MLCKTGFYMLSKKCQIRLWTGLSNHYNICIFPFVVISTCTFFMKKFYRHLGRFRTLVGIFVHVAFQPFNYDNWYLYQIPKGQGKLCRIFCLTDKILLFLSKFHVKLVRNRPMTMGRLRTTYFFWKSAKIQITTLLETIVFV